MTECSIQGRGYQAAPVKPGAQVRQGQPPLREGAVERGQNVKHLQSSPYSLVKKIENIAKTPQCSVFWVESVTSKLGKEKKERLLSTAFFTSISTCRGNSIGSGILHHTSIKISNRYVDFINPLLFTEINELF